MATTAQSLSVGTRRESHMLRGWPSLAMTVIVFFAALYSFSPRPMPPFAATEVHPGDILVSGLARSGQRLIAAGEQGHILYADSVDGPWGEAHVEPQRGSTFTQVRFIGDRTAIAVGHDGWIVRSQDNGQTWTEVNFGGDPPDPLLGVAGPYQGKLFAFGGFGRYMVSTDLGKTWTEERHEVLGDHHLNGMTRLADGSLMLVGERGLIARSADNGETWTTDEPIYAGSFFGVLNLPNKDVLVYGMRGHAFYSSDFGRTWTESKVPDQDSLFGGTVDDDGNVVLVGAANAIMRSTDNGRSFEVVSESSRNGLTDLIALKQGGWMTAGEGGLSIQQPRAPAAAEVH